MAMRTPQRAGPGLAWGVAAGGVAAVVFARLLASLLFDVSPGDPATFAAVMALMLGGALGACGIPAARAVAVEPADRVLLDIAVAPVDLDGLLGRPHGEAAGDQLRLGGRERERLAAILEQGRAVDEESGGLDL